MAKRKFTLTPKQENELKAAYQQCREGVTKIRYKAVRLYGSGYPVNRAPLLFSQRTEGAGL